MKSLTSKKSPKNEEIVNIDLTGEPENKDKISQHSSSSSKKSGVAKPPGIDLTAIFKAHRGKFFDAKAEKKKREIAALKRR